MSDDGDGIDRRRLLELTGATTTMSALSGCAGAIENLIRGADEAYEEFEARPAGFSESGATSLGLGSMETVSYDTRREPTIGGETYIVDETHRITTYGGDADRRYRLGVLSTPGARIDATRTNPIADQDLGSFLTGQHGTRLLDKMGVPNDWISGPERVDRLERAHLLTSQWPLEVYGGEFPSDQGLFGRRVAIIRGIEYDGGEVVVAVCTGTDASPDDVAEWERARAILNEEGGFVQIEPSWSGSQVPNLDVADLRPVQTVENSTVDGEASVSDPPIVMDEPAALLFDIESDAASPAAPDYLRAKLLLDRDRKESVREEFDIRYGIHSPSDVEKLLNGAPESAVFHEAADDETWRYGSREWSIAPPLLELLGANLSATLELTTPVGNRVARQKIEEGKDFETSLVPTLRVGFIELQDPGVIRSTDIDYGTSFGRAKFYDRSVKSSFEFLRRVFPGQVVAYKHDDNTMLGNVKELHDDGTGKDAAEARKTLNSICGESRFPSGGTVLTGDIDRDEAVDMMDADEGGGFDIRVIILPWGTEDGNENYFSAHGMDDTGGLHWSTNQAVGSLESDDDDSDNWHASTTAQEVGHRFAQRLYDGALARIDDDGDKDSWHAAVDLESVGYDLTEGAFSLVTDPDVTDGVFSIDPPTDDDNLVEESYPSYMSYAGPPMWADSRVHDLLIDGSFTPGYQGPANTSGSAGTAAEQRDEETDVRGGVQPVIEAFGSVGDGGVQFSSSAVYDAIPGDADGDEFDPDRHPEATPVQVTLRDPNDEALVTVTVPDRTEGTHHQRDHESVAVSLPFHEAGVTVVTNREDERTELNAVVDPLRDALGRVPDRGTEDGDAVSAAEETLDEVAGLMADGEFSEAADRLDGPFRGAIDDSVRAEYDRFANEPVRKEVIALTERMIERLDVLGRDQSQGQQLECGAQLPGTIAEDTVLQRGCTYTLPDGAADTVDIKDGARLQLQPGVEVEMGQGKSIDVTESGAISAQGTAENPIEIRGSVAATGHWQGIIIQSDNPANELSHVTVAHAGEVYWNTAINVVQQATIQNCTVRESSSAGIKARKFGELVDFRDNRIANVEGPAMHLHPNQVRSLSGTTTFENIGEGHIRVQPDTASADERVVEDGTWPAMSLPYEFTGTTTIESEIEIEEGTTMQFQQGDPTRLFVANGGRMVAEGTAERPITYQGAVEAPGYWGGIFIQTPTDNVLANVVVRDAGGGYRDANVGVGIDGQGAVAIRNSMIANSASAGVLATERGDIAGFQDNHFENIQGPPLHLHPEQLQSLNGDSTFTNNDQSHVLVFPGKVVSEDGGWPAMDVPYEFSGSTTIEAEIELGAGTTLQFQSGGPTRLFVANGGRLVSEGTEGRPITYQGVEDTPGVWSGIFIQTPTDNVFRNVVVSDGGGGYRNANIGVGIDGQGKLDITESEITDSAGWGIILSEGTLTAENNTFSNNAEGDIQRPDE